MHDDTEWPSDRPCSGAGSTESTIEIDMLNRKIKRNDCMPPSGSNDTFKRVPKYEQVKYERRKNHKSPKIIPNAYIRNNIHDSLVTVSTIQLRPSYPAMNWSPNTYLGIQS